MAEQNANNPLALVSGSGGGAGGGGASGAGRGGGTTSESTGGADTSNTSNEPQRRWVEATYKDVWVPNVVTLTREVPYQDTEYDEVAWYCHPDGFRTTDQAASQAHSEELFLSGQADISNYWVVWEYEPRTVTKYRTETYTEDQGHWETAVDVPAHWEEY